MKEKGGRVGGRGNKGEQATFSQMADIRLAGWPHHFQRHEFEAGVRGKGNIG